jgi:hypothetical protein
LLSCHVSISLALEVATPKSELPEENGSRQYFSVQQVWVLQVSTELFQKT